MTELELSLLDGAQSGGHRWLQHRAVRTSWDLAVLQRAEQERLAGVDRKSRELRRERLLEPFRQRQELGGFTRHRSVRGGW